jgi:hypothetical protein
MPSFVKGKRAGLAGVWLAVIAAIGLLPAAPGQAAEPPSFDYSAYARVLADYVTPGGQVRYADLKANPKDLNIFVRQLENVSPASHPGRFPGAKAKMAYWINAYNAFTVYAVVEAYPVKSVRDFKFGFGFLFFKRAKFVAGGKVYSLDDIEHGILRKQFSDPRIHFAVNCASTSCPPLQREPYTPDRLNEQLEEAARQFIGKQENVWMRGDVLFLSKIFDWYDEDFEKWLAQQGAAKPTVADYVTGYLAEPVAERVRKERPRVEFYDYDWALNDDAD